MNERQQQITDNHLNNRCEIVTSRDPNGRARSCACTVQTLAAKRLDLHNTVAREGVDRCTCGCKYWEWDRCEDCRSRLVFKSASELEPGDAFRDYADHIYTVVANERYSRDDDAVIVTLADANGQRSAKPFGVDAQARVIEPAGRTEAEAVARTRGYGDDSDELPRVPSDVERYLLDLIATDDDGVEASSFTNAGVMTTDAGLLLRIDGSEFQLTIVQSR